LAYVEQALVARLEAVSGVADTVYDSSFSGYRIYPYKLPQNPTLPAITYTLIYGESLQSHSGSSGLRFPRYQVDAWTTLADGYDSAKALQEQIRLALQGWTGTAAGVRVTAILKDSDNPDYYDQDLKIWRVSTDYSVHHEEEIPS